MFNRYRKSIAGAITGLAGWGLAASADSVYTQQEWWGLVVIAGGIVAVWGLPNDPPSGEPADPDVSERGHSVIETVVVALLVSIVVTASILYFT